MNAKKPLNMQRVEKTPWR